MKNSKWKTVSLQEVCEITSSKRIYAKEYVNDGIPFYRSKEIIQKHNRERINEPLYISKNRFLELKNKFGAPQKGDILLTSVGTLGVPYYVEEDDSFYFKDGNLIWFKNFEENIKSSFIYYWMHSNDFKQKLHKITIGSTQQALTIKNLQTIQINLPNFKIQNQISSILSSIDSKIDINIKINEKLEETAKAIYNEWFVNFNFPDENGLPYKDNGGEFYETELGEIPVGWKIKSISKFVEFENGYPFKSKSYKQQGKYSVITIKNVQDGYIETNNVSFIEDLPENLPDHCILNTGDILMSLTGNVGRVGVVYKENLLLNQRVCKIRPRKSEYQAICYFMFRDERIKEKLINISRGTAQKNLSPIEASKIKFAFPKINILRNYNNIATAIFDKLIQIFQENLTLIEIRDTILNKLMSGEINTEELDIDWEKLEETLKIVEE